MRQLCTRLVMTTALVAALPVLVLSMALTVVAASVRSIVEVWR